MTGSPLAILSPGASLGTTFTIAPPFATVSQPWVSTASGSINATSATVYLNTSLQLLPAVMPASNSIAAAWNYFGYWTDDSTFLLYSYDHVHWLSYPWRNKFVVSRNVWVRSTHRAEPNSGASVSPVVVYTAKPYLVVHYLPTTHRLYGTANVPTGTKIVVQKRTSTGTWVNYYTAVPVSKYAWGLTLPKGTAQWRVVVPATSLYIATISATVSTS